MGEGLVDGGGAERSRPFVFIASFPRTGSTVLAEALTEWPHAFVHVEPGLTWGRLATLGLERGGQWELGLADALAAARALHDDVDPIDHYLDQVVPLLPFAQVGVKEVSFRRGRSRRLLRTIDGEARVVVTVRDPRDIWVSLMELSRRIDADNFFYRGKNLDQIVEDFERILKHVGELVDNGAMVVTYEDLCTDPSVIPAVREFVGSPVGTGELGANVEHFGRRWETQRHGTGLSDRGIGRWRDEDGEARADAERFAARLGEYCERFGY